MNAVVKIAVLLLSLAAIALSVADIIEMAMNPQGGIRIEGVDGLVIFFLKSVGLPLMLSSLAFNIVFAERKGNSIPPLFLVIPFTVLMLVLFFVGAFIGIMIFALLYGLLAGWIAGFLPAGIVDRNWLTGMILFFFIAEFFFEAFRHVLTGASSLKFYKDGFFELLKGTGGITDKIVAYATAAGLAVSSLKLALVFLWFALLFSGVASKPWETNMLPTAIAGFIFTLVPYLILERLFAGFKK